MMIYNESMGIGVLMEKFLKATNCPLCDASTKSTIKTMKTKMVFIRTHFCTSMNGSCVVKCERKFKKSPASGN